MPLLGKARPLHNICRITQFYEQKKKKNRKEYSGIVASLINHTRDTFLYKNYLIWMIIIILKAKIYLLFSHSCQYL